MVMPETEVSYDRSSGIVRCRLKGLWTSDIVDQYERTLKQAVSSARRYAPEVLMLFDSSEAPAQPPAIVERMRAVGEAVRGTNDRLAVVVGSVLTKMQAERSMTVATNERVFRTVADAEAWLKA